jgi:phage terminase large subunit GpA-like protein
MAVYKWRCPTCGVGLRILADTRPTTEKTCNKDGSVLVSENEVSSMVKERLDNGIMPKAVERIKDVEQMVKERSQDVKDPGLV